MEVQAAQHHVRGAWGRAGWHGRIPGKQQHQGNHVASIFSVYVMDGYRRAGIAEKLMDFIMGELRSRGNVIKITLGVIAPGEAAVSLYRKIGFQVAGMLGKQLRIGEEFHDGQLMELLL